MLLSRIAPKWIQWVRRELRPTGAPSRILLGVLGAVLLGIGAALIHTIAAERRAREQVELTTKALSLLRQSLLAGTDAETGQRGFLLTENQAFLEPFERGSKAWLPALSKLRSTLADSATPEQEATIARLEQLATARLAITKQILDLFQAGERKKALAMVTTTAPKRIMDDYRAVASTLEESQTAAQRQAIAEARAVEARMVPIIFLLGASIFGLIIITLRLERRTVLAEAAARDADDLREAQARSDLLARELNHRVKNLFAVILSIVVLSAREETDVKRLVANIRSRIYALSLAHAVSQGQSGGEIVALREVVSAILKPFENEQGRIKLEGENVELPAKAVTPLGLVIHELATNAVKYGALSVDGGTLQVSWTTREGQLGREVELLWKENHGPAVAQERVAGFGSNLLERASLQLGGRIDRDWLADGLCAKLVFPLETQ